MRFFGRIISFRIGFYLFVYGEAININLSSEYIASLIWIRRLSFKIQYYSPLSSNDEAFIELLIIEM